MTSDRTLSEQFLQALFHLAGRAAYSEDDLRKIVEGGRTGTKQRKAFNLADGTRSQQDIAKKLRLDPGNFSRTVNRWVRSGVMIRVMIDGESRPLHVYPLDE